MRQYISKYKYVLLFILVSISFCALFSPYTSVLNPYYGIDTAQYWVIGNGIISKGKLPYVDLFDHKGPLIFLIWAIGIFLGNGSKWGIFFLQNISFIICLIYVNTVLDIFKITVKKKFFIYAAFLFMLCGVIIEGGLSEEWALPCTMYSIAVALRYIHKDINRKPYFYAFIFGVEFAYVAGMRLNNAVGIGAVTLFLIIYMLKRKQYKIIAQCALAFLGGMLLITVPIIVWFGMNGALSDLLYGSIIFNIQYAGNGLFGKSILQWGRVIGFEGVTLLILSGSFVREKKTKGFCKKWEYFLAFMLVILCGVNCMLGDTWPHYFMSFLPAVVLVMGLIAEEMALKKLIMILLLIALPYSYQSFRNAGKSLLFIGFDYYSGQQDSISKISQVIPENEKDSVWAIEWRSSKWFAINDITPYYKVFDFPHVLSSPQLYDDTVMMLKTAPPLWILREKDAPDYLEGYSDFLEDNYAIEDYVIYKPEKITDAPEELIIEIWRRKDVD